MCLMMYKHTQKSHQLERSDFQKVTQFFIRATRQGHSQEWFSDSLKYNFNVVSRWETGSRQFYWDDFIVLAKMMKWNVSFALQSVTHFKFSLYPDSHEIITQLMVPSTRNILKSSFSNQKINRLGAGKSKIIFGDFLLILDRAYGRSQRFLNSFLSESQQAGLTSFYSIKTEYADLLSREPMLCMLHLALALDDYKALPVHSNLYLAQLLNTTEESIQRSLDKLEDVGAIQKKDKLYRVASKSFDTGVQSKELSQKINSHFRTLISNAIDKHGRGEYILSSYLVYATNPALEEKIFDVCRKFYIDIRNLTIEHQDESTSEVRYLGVDLFYPLKKNTK